MYRVSWGEWGQLELLLNCLEVCNRWNLISLFNFFLIWSRAQHFHRSLWSVFASLPICHFVFKFGKLIDVLCYAKQRAVHLLVQKIHRRISAPCENTCSELLLHNAWNCWADLGKECPPGSGPGPGQNRGGSMTCVIFIEFCQLWRHPRLGLYSARVAVTVPGGLSKFGLPRFVTWLIAVWTGDRFCWELVWLYL